MREKLYSVAELLESLDAVGLPCSRMWLRTAEQQGKLVCPRLPNGRRDRVFTSDQIEEIVKAFMPDGVGVWKA